MKGSATSHTTNIHLVKYALPVKQCKSTTDVVCLHLLKADEQTLFPDARHVNGEHVCDLKLAAGDRALVLAVDLVYYTNDSSSRLEMDLDLRFSSCVEVSAASTASLHPDYTGHVKFVLEPGHQGKVSESDRRLYEPNFLNLGFDLLPFAGQEHAILQPKSWVVTDAHNQIQYDYEVFPRTDPFIVFIVENRQHFKWITQSDILICDKDKMHYKVRKDAVERVRTFFKDVAFPLFHYTRSNGFSLAWKVVGRLIVPEDEDYDDQPLKNDGFAMVVMVLEVTYVVIKQDLAQFYLERLEIK